LDLLLQIGSFRITVSTGIEFGNKLDIKTGILMNRRREHFLHQHFPDFIHEQWIEQTLIKQFPQLSLTKSILRLNLEISLIPFHRQRIVPFNVLEDLRSVVES
jgi:hypothetical protein